MMKWLSLVPLIVLILIWAVPRIRRSMEAERKRAEANRAYWAERHRLEKINGVEEVWEDETVRRIFCYFYIKGKRHTFFRYPNDWKWYDLDDGREINVYYIQTIEAYLRHNEMVRLLEKAADRRTQLLKEAKG